MVCALSCPKARSIRVNNSTLQRSKRLRTSIVVPNIAEVIPSAIVSFSDYNKASMLEEIVKKEMYQPAAESWVSHTSQ